MLFIRYSFMLFTGIITAFFFLILLLILLIVKSKTEAFKVLNVFKNINKRYITIGIVSLWAVITLVIISTFNIKSKNEISNFFSSLSRCNRIHVHGVYVNRIKGEHEKVDLNVEDIKVIKNLSQLIQNASYTRTVLLAGLSASEYLNFDIYENEHKLCSFELIYNLIIINKEENRSVYVCHKDDNCLLLETAKMLSI